MVILAELTIDLTMETKENNITYRIKWFWRIIRHGLFFHGLKNRLARIGIDIVPYYWVQEETEPVTPPKIRDDSGNQYIVSYLGEKDLEQIKTKVKGIEHNDLLQNLRDGEICIGIKKDEEIVAFMFIQLDNVLFKGRTIPLKTNEAYLKDMYTFEDFRGRNIAPYLRYQSYELLRERGIDVKYSISGYFNKSTFKFKKKLNSKLLNLHLSIILFNKGRWNFKIKDCN